MDANRAIRRLMFSAVAFVASVITLGVVTAPDDAPNRPPSAPGTVSSYSHDQLQRDATMTQQMSTPNADTDSQYHANDGQLDRSQSAGYVARTARRACRTRARPRPALPDWLPPSGLARPR
jgi:hypothetical protein